MSRDVDSVAVETMAHVAQQFIVSIQDGVQAMIRPSVLYRPELTQTDNSWKATYGAFAVYGATPGLAMNNFDMAWDTRKSVPYAKRTSG